MVATQVRLELARSGGGREPSEGEGDSARSVGGPGVMCKAVQQLSWGHGHELVAMMNVSSHLQ